jgi:hypothetical protein
MTRDEAIKDKKKAIAGAYIGLAGEMVNLVLLCLPPRKKLFQQKNRTPLRRNKLIVQKTIQYHRMRMAQVRLYSIMSQPIPKYNKGGDTSDGIAVVGTNDSEEIIITHGGKEIRTNNFIPKLPTLPSL